MRLKFWSLDWNSLVTPKKTSVASFCEERAGRESGAAPRPPGTRSQARAFVKVSPWFTK